MQQVLIAGDSLLFQTQVPAYPSTAGWTLRYRLVPRLPTSAAIDLAATASGSGYQVSAPASTTAGWVPGTYAWSSWVDLAGETYTVAQGVITIKPNPRTAAAGFDDRTQAEKDLEAVNAVITARVSGGAVIEYTINNRSLKREPMAALLELKGKLTAIVARQRRAQAAANGLGKKGRLAVRFGR